MSLYIKEENWAAWTRYVEAVEVQGPHHYLGWDS